MASDDDARKKITGGMVASGATSRGAALRESLAKGGTIGGLPLPVVGRRGAQPGGGVGVPAAGSGGGGHEPRHGGREPRRGAGEGLTVMRGGRGGRVVEATRGGIMEARRRGPVGGVVVRRGEQGTRPGR